MDFLSIVRAVHQKKEKKNTRKNFLPPDGHLSKKVGMARVFEQALGQKSSLVVARENLLLFNRNPLALLERPLLSVSHGLQSQPSNEKKRREGINPVQGSVLNERRLPAEVNRGDNKDQEQVLEKTDESNVEEEPENAGDLGSNVRPAIIFAVESIASLAVKVVSQSDSPDRDQEGGDIKARDVVEGDILWPVEHIPNSIVDGVHGWDNRPQLINLKEGFFCSHQR